MTHDTHANGMVEQAAGAGSTDSSVDHQSQASCWDTGKQGQTSSANKASEDCKESAQSITESTSPRAGAGPAKPLDLVWATGRQTSELQLQAESTSVGGAGCLTDRSSCTLNATRSSSSSLCPMNLVEPSSPTELGLADILRRLVAKMEATSELEHENDKADDSDHHTVKEEKEQDFGLRNRSFLSLENEAAELRAKPDKVIEFSWADSELKQAAELRLALLRVQCCRCFLHKYQPQGQGDADSAEILETNCQTRFLSKLSRCTKSRSMDGNSDTRRDDFVGACLALFQQSKRLQSRSSSSTTTTTLPPSAPANDGAKLKDNGENESALLQKPIQRATDQIFINARLYSPSSAAESSDAAPASPQTSPRVPLERVRVLGVSRSTSNGLQRAHNGGQPTEATKIPLSHSSSTALRSSLEFHWRLCHELILVTKCRSLSLTHQALVGSPPAHYLSSGNMSECCPCCECSFNTVNMDPEAASEPPTRIPSALSLLEPYIDSFCFQLNRATVLELDESGAGQSLVQLLVAARLPATRASRSSPPASLVVTWAAGRPEEPSDQCRRLVLVPSQHQAGATDAGSNGEKSRRPLLCGQCSTHCLVASVANVQVPPNSSESSPIKLSSTVQTPSEAQAPIDCNKLPSNNNSTTTTTNNNNSDKQTTLQTQPETDTKPGLECSHLSLLIREEQRQANLAMVQQKRADYMEQEADGDSGSEPCNSGADYLEGDVDGSRSEESLSSSDSTNFPPGSSSGSSTNGFECSVANEFGQNSCSRRICCRPMPTCKACQLNGGARPRLGIQAPSDKWHRNSSTASATSLRKPATGSNQPRLSASHCDCVTSTPESLANRQLAPCARSGNSVNSLQNPQPQPSLNIQNAQSNCERKPHSPVPITITKSLEQQIDKPHLQPVGVLQNATEQIKRRSMRLSQLIRGTSGFRSGLSSSKSKPGVVNADEKISNNNNSRTNSDEDPFSSSLAMPGTTSGYGNHSILINATTTDETGQVASVSTVVESKAVSSAQDRALVPVIGDGCKQKASMNYSVNFTTNSRALQPSIDIPTVDSTSSNNSHGHKSVSSKHSHLMASVINLMQPSHRQQASASDRKHDNDPTISSKWAKKEAAAAAASTAPINRHRAGGSRRRREKNAARRERKATKTLAIVLGIFLICWTPFFTCNIIDGICIQLDMDCRPGMMVYLVTSWLGYINSCVNPIIYTIFNMEFRRAFKKILTTRPKCCIDN